MIESNVCPVTCQVVLGGENQTDVATGQANPTISSQLQEGIESLSSGSGNVYNQESYQRQVNFTAQVYILGI